MRATATTAPCGYVDPDIRAFSERDAVLIDTAKARGFTLVRLPGKARAVHLFGPGYVNVKAANLAALSLADLGAHHVK